MSAHPTFDELVADAEAAPVDGWGFAWLDGRATEERPPWGYARMLAPRVEAARAMLDVQTGGGEVLAEVLGKAQRRPGTVAATESWPPNAAIAREHLGALGGIVYETPNEAAFPFSDETFDLVVSRHPVVTRWDEIARVLMPRGRYFAQHIGPGSNRELTEFFMGPQAPSDARRPDRAAADAAACGLTLVDLREARLRLAFYDVGAIVWFLRKVIWTVPGFSVARYGHRLRALDEQIRHDGVFISHAQRFLIELEKPAAPEQSSRDWSHE